MSREYTKGMDLTGFRPGPKVADLAGQKHGDFSIISYMGGSQWLCRCTKCGAEKNVSTWAINRGQIVETCRQCRWLFEPSDREREVMALVAQGMTSKQVAAELTISARTVQTHISNLLAKFNIASRTQLASIYYTQEKR